MVKNKTGPTLLTHNDYLPSVDHTRFVSNLPICVDIPR